VGHGQRQPILWVADVVLAIDDNSFAVLDLINDDGLVRHFAGGAINLEKIDCVEQIGLHLLAQLR
jgi:hypothetical protein